MSTGQGWQNPITALPGQIQRDVDPAMLKPSRGDLLKIRLESQRSLLLAGRARFSPIQVSPQGVIVDGHHAVRAAAEAGRLVDVLVSGLSVPSVADSILDLTVR